MNNFATTLIEVFKTLSINPNLKYVEDESVVINLGSGKNIIAVNSKGITTPINRINSIYKVNISPLPDTKPNLHELSAFISKLTDKNAIIRLNHIGICYKTESQIAERKLLAKEIANTNLNLYEEPSNDKGLWLFVGDTTKWDDPLLELLPVEDTTDEWVNYWLPHFQIDIDTNLDHGINENLVIETFTGNIKPIRITVIDGVTYTIRIRLGIVDGVNIDLDIATNARNVEYARKHILQKLN